VLKFGMTNAYLFTQITSCACCDEHTVCGWRANPCVLNGYKRHPLSKLYCSTVWACMV